MFMYRLRGGVAARALFSPDDGGGAGGGDGDKGGDKGGDKSGDKLPPSKHDEPLKQGQETFDRAYVEELPAENKTWRGKLTAERSAREASERERDAAKAEAAKVKADAEAAANGKITEATKKADERVIRAEMKAVAAKAGIVDLDALKLADLSKVTVDENGEVKGAAEVIEQLKKDKPYLFGDFKGNTNNDNKAPPKKGDTPKKAGEMTDEEYKAALRAIDATGKVPA